MRRSNILAGFAIAALIIGPALAHADLASDLRAQIAVVLAKLAAAQAAPTQSPIPAFSSSGTGVAAGECPTLAVSLSLGAKGDAVAELQRYLSLDPNIYPEGIVSGYFGPATERAVQRWQSAHGVVSSGTPGTTGYGVVGARTRQLIALNCATAPTQSIAPPQIITYTCPVYQIPYCPTGTIVALGVDPNGCVLGYRCTATTTPDVTTATQPIVGVNCPVYRDAICSAGQKSAHGSLDIKGCVGPSACIPDNF